MEIHQLKYAVAVAETGNFTRAAQRCFVSQPSLSQQIMKLEEELDHKLFHRMGRRAVLTPAGEYFLGRARQILFELDNTTKELKDDPSIARRIVIGAIPTVAPYILPGLLEACRRRFPHVQVDTREDFRLRLVESVIEGELDWALIALPVSDRRLLVEPLFREPLLLALPPQHPLVRKESITIGDLAEQPFVLLGDSSSLTSQIQQFCGDHDFQPRVAHRCGQVATVKALIAIGQGVSLLPELTRSPDDEGSLVYRVLSGRAPAREIGVVRHRHRYESKAAGQVINLLRQRIENHEGWAVGTLTPIQASASPVPG